MEHSGKLVQTQVYRFCKPFSPYFTEVMASSLFKHLACAILAGKAMPCLADPQDFFIFESGNEFLGLFKFFY